MPLVNISNIHALILDMDGVIWRGSRPIGDLPHIFNTISNKNLKFVLATNNSTLTVDQYVKKLREFGVLVEQWQVVNSSQATGTYLQKKFPEGGNVFTIGEVGLIETLDEYGFTTKNMDHLAVVVGMDRNLNYEKLKTATLMIRAGTPFVATNPDRTFPIPEGLVPGAGSIIAYLKAATDIDPIIIGKPYPIMYNVALERLGTSPANTLVVGDRLETDIAGAQDIGCMTAVVLSGVTDIEQTRKWSPPPNYVAHDLFSLLKEI